MRPKPSTSDRSAFSWTAKTLKCQLKAAPTITTTGTPIDFSVELSGGQIDPDISWDFDASNGLQRQAVGPKIKYIYKKPGDYVVTVTVTDRSGIQPTITKTVGLRIDKSTRGTVSASSSTSSGGTKDRKNPTALDSEIEVK